MELELGLKITRTRDDDDDDHCSTCVSELRIAKDRAGPVFLSKETHAMFILTVHLKGYKRKNIEIMISEDGKEISISGEKPIQEMLMTGWVMMRNNQVEILGFKKVFKIPNGVVLDRIKAKYNEEESVLKILMPKVVKMIYGVQIEEVKEEEFGESSQKASEVGENESILEKEEELTNKKLLEATNGKIIVDTNQKEIEKHRFEIGNGFEEMRNLELAKSEEDQQTPKNIGETSQQNLKEPMTQIQPLKDRDNVMLVGEIGGTNTKEIETEDRDEEGKEINKEEQETILKTTIQGGEYESLLATPIGVNGDEIVEEAKQRETKLPKFETEDKDRECMVGEEISKEGVEAKETSLKEQIPIAENLLGESKNVLVMTMGLSEEDMNGETKKTQSKEPKFEIEDGDRESLVGEEMSKEGVEEIETEMKKQVPKEPILLGESENVLARANVFSEEDMNREKKQKQIEEPKFEIEDRDRESVVGEEISKEVVEDIKTEKKKQVSKAPIILGESNIMLARENGFYQEDVNGETKQKETEEPMFEIEDKNRQSVVVEESSKEGVEGTKTEMKEQISKAPTILGEYENVFVRENGSNGETKQEEIEEPQLETKDRDKESKVEEETCKEGIEEIETETKEQVPKASSPLGESKNVLAKAIGLSGEDMNEERKQKEIEDPKFEIEDKNRESVVGEEINKEGIEGIKTEMKEKVSKAPTSSWEAKNVFAREIGSNGEALNRETKQKEIEEPKFETKDRDRESMVDEEICKERVEEIETKMKEQVLKASSLMGEPKNLMAATIGFKEEDRNEVTKQKEAEAPKFESQDKNKESVVREEVSKEEVEATKIEMKEQVPKAPALLGESENLFAREIGSNGKKVNGSNGEDMNGETKQNEIEEPSFETKDRDRESVVEEETCKEGVEEIENKMKEHVPKTSSLLGQYENVLVRALGFSGEDMNGETEQEHNEEPKFKTKDRDRKSMAREEISKEKVEEKKVEMKEQVSKAPIQLGESKNDFTKSIWLSGEHLNEETIQKETKEPKFGMEEEISCEGFEVTKGEHRIIGGEKQKEIEEPKFEAKEKDKEWVIEDIGMEGFEAKEHSESTAECMEGGEDINRVAKQRGTEEPEFKIVKEQETKIPKGTKAKVEEMGEIKGVEESIARRDIRKATSFMEKMGEEEHKKMNQEASKVIEKGYAKEAEQKGVEENIVKKAFEALGTIKEEFSEHMVETEAKREREMKVKGEEVIKMYDEAKTGVHKEMIGERVHMEIGQPSIGFKDSDKGGYHAKESLEVSKKEEPKVIKQDYLETKPSVEKVKGENNEKLQDEGYGGFQKDKIREITKEEIEEPQVGTKHKDQHCIQEELTMQMGSSLANRNEGPKDTNIEKMEEAQEKSEETEVLENDESMMKEEIQEMNTKKACKKEQITKDLREVAEQKDQEAMEKGITDRETSRQSTQQSEAKGKGKSCEDCKISEATLEIEKHRETEKVIDEKPRTRKEVQHVAETVQKTLEKWHPNNSKEADRKQETIEAKVTYPTVTKTFEPKNVVKNSKLKDLSPPKVEIRTKESLESESQSMKLKFQKEQKFVPEAKEEEEEYKAAERSKLKSSSSTQGSIVEEQGNSDKKFDKQKSKIDFLGANERWTSLPDKTREDFQPNILADQSLEEKEFNETLVENRGQQYITENFDEKGFETKDISNEEKTSQKDQAEIMPRKSKGTRIAKSEDEEKLEVHGKTRELEGVGDDNINEFKQVELIKKALDDSETENSQKELVLAQREIQREEEIRTTRMGQQEDREIPFHVSEISNSEVVLPKREVNPPKVIDTHLEATMIEFEKHEPNCEVQKLQSKKQSSPSSKKPYELAKPIVKQHAPRIENVPQLQEVEESINPIEGKISLEVITNEVDRPSTEKSEVDEKGKLDECFEAVHFQESTKRRFDLEVDKIRSVQQEEEVDKIRSVQQEEEVDKIRSVQQEEEVEKIRSVQQEENEEGGGGGGEEEEAGEGGGGGEEEEEEVGGGEEDEEKGDEEEGGGGGGGDEFKVENAYEEDEGDEVEVENTQEEKEEGDEVEVESTQELEMLEDIEMEGSEDKKKEGDESDEVEVEKTQELEVLEDIQVEESEDKKKVRTPLVIAGSAFLASLIIFFVRHRRVGKRYSVFDKI